MRAGIFAAAAVLMLAGSAAAQGTQAAQATEDAQAQARYKVFVMEGALERAVERGAAVLSRQVRAISPDAMFLTGTAQVRGFRLDGYGVFFDVEVPALRPTVAWTLRAMIDDNGASLAQLKAYVSRVQNAEERAELQRAIRNLELQMPTRVAAGDTVSAQTLAVGTAATPSADPLLLSDPAAAYTREVKSALIEAMLENSAPLAISEQEWLTVAARDGEPSNRLVPGDAYDLTTTVMRVRGSDLIAYRTGRITLEEAKHKVEVKEF
ncbi:MAG: hypothetical protein AB7K63_10235 [Vicinamibacterales bacterium]